jgi:two-component sensor histidine kinase
VALQQKSVLLREVSHRVKNNLQVISSILNLHADTIDDPRLGILFQESQDRLHSMALVHDLLQQADDVARINLAPYAARLTDELARTYAIDPARIMLETELEDVWVGLDTATPCGLLPARAADQLFQARFSRREAGARARRATRDG